GDDFDDRIMAWLADDFLTRHGLDLRQNKYCLQMLKEAGERAKIEVGRDGAASIHVPAICPSPEGEVLDVTQRLTQDQFNRMVMDLVQRTFKVCDEALQAARLTAGDVDAVILVGGPTRLPIIRNSVRHYFQREPMTGVDPDEVVSIGAALQARALLSTTAAEAGQASYLLDVTPLSLRVGTVGGFTEPIIEKNTPIPIEKSKTFTTSRDGQDRVRIRVYQGESNRADGCELLGEFEFTGFRIGYRGEVQIQVTFEIDSNGIVAVSAADVETGQRTSTTINLSSGLTEQEIRQATDDNAGIELSRGTRAA
ncbi:MAG TPA: Hsp70 family protein, partial [Gemmatimonadales bacterium]|nr:Hsp70 family protein [Gemmatimonadales bacterium]